MNPGAVQSLNVCLSQQEGGNKWDMLKHIEKEGKQLGFQRIENQGPSTCEASKSTSLDSFNSACQPILIFFFFFFEVKVHYYRWFVQYQLSGWPSGLRRQTQGYNLQ